MATQSILKTIRVSTKGGAHRLIVAMESAKNWKARKAGSTKMHRELKGSEVREFFGDR